MGSVLSRPSRVRSFWPGWSFEPCWSMTVKKFAGMVILTTICESAETAVTTKEPASRLSAGNSSSAVARPFLSLKVVMGACECPSFTSMVTSSLGRKPSAVIRARSPDRYDNRSVVILPLRTKEACAPRPEEPIASSTRSTPAVSFAFMDHVVLNAPSASALMNHGSWPIPVSTVPPVCATRSITLSNGENPVPEILIMSPAR